MRFALSSYCRRSGVRFNEVKVVNTISSALIIAAVSRPLPKREAAKYDSDAKQGMTSSSCQTKQSMSFCRSCMGGITRPPRPTTCHPLSSHEIFFRRSSLLLHVDDNHAARGPPSDRGPLARLPLKGKSKIDVELLEEELTEGGAVADVDPVAGGRVLLLALALARDDVVVALGAGYGARQPDLLVGGLLVDHVGPVVREDKG